MPRPISNNSTDPYDYHYTQPSASSSRSTQNSGGQRAATTASSSTSSSAQHRNAGRGAAARAMARMAESQAAFAANNAAALSATALTPQLPAASSSRAAAHLHTLVSYGNIHPSAAELAEAEQNVADFYQYEAQPLISLNVSRAALRQAVATIYPGSARDSDATIRQAAESLNDASQQHNQSQADWYRMGPHINAAKDNLSRLGMHATDYEPLRALLPQAFQANYLNTQTYDAYNQALQEMGNYY